MPAVKNNKVRFCDKLVDFIVDTVVWSVNSHSHWGAAVSRLTENLIEFKRRLCYTRKNNAAK